LNVSILGTRWKIIDPDDQTIDFSRKSFRKWPVKKNNNIINLNNYVDHYFPTSVISLTNPELVGMANRFRLWEKNDFNSFSWVESFAKYDNVPRTYWVLFAIKIFLKSVWGMLKWTTRWIIKNINGLKK
jgi:hypothetical protein